METLIKKSTLKINLEPEDYHDLLEQNEVYRHDEGGMKNICIYVHPNDFPIKKDTKAQNPDNFGVREQKGGVYMIKVSLCELLDPITKRITGKFINSDDFSEYTDFELNLELD